MLAEILRAYLKLFPAEEPGLKLLAEQIKDGDIMNNRKNFRGHITAGGLVLSPDRTKMLLIHHKASGLWLQPAGHWDKEDDDLLAAAKREIDEETTAKLAKYLPIEPSQKLVPLDIDTHPIPARKLKNEVAHFHHDFRYVFLAASEKVSAQVEEVHAVKWLPIAGIKFDYFERPLKKLRDFGFV